MKTYQIQVLEPKARKLLEELANLKLIKIEEMDEPKEQFRKLVARIRTKADKKPSLTDITKEVESVRKKRYGKK